MCANPTMGVALSFKCLRKIRLDLAWSGLRSRLKRRKTLVRYKCSRLLLLLLCVLVHTCIPLAFRRLKYSIYFTPDVAAMKSIESERRRQAEAFFEVQRRPMVNEHVNRNRFCVVVISDTRNPSYLLPSVFSVMRSMDDGMKLVVYNAQRLDEPSNAVQADLETLRKHGVEVVDAVSLLDNSCYKESCTPAVKEALDYARAMGLCTSRHDSQYVVVLEDDAYATKDFSWKLRNLVEEVNHKPTTRQWLLVKLFLTSHWSGWALNAQDIATLVACGAPTTAFVYILLRCVTAPALGVRVFNKYRRLLIYVWAMSVYLAIALNKQNTPFNRYNYRGIHVLDKDNVASTVGHLYPMDQAVKLEAYLLEHSSVDKDRYEGGLPCDLLIGNFAKVHNLVSYVRVPTLVEHTGVFSSLGWKRKLRNKAPEQALYHYVKTSTWFEEGVDIPSG